MDTDVVPVEVSTSLRPDLIIRNYRRKRTFHLDLKVPYDSLSNFSNSRAANYAKYKHLVTDIYRASSHDVTLDAIIVGCLGSLDPLNESVLRQMSLTLEQIKKLAITMTIQAAKESYTTYLTYISGEDGDLATQKA